MCRPIHFVYGSPVRDPAYWGPAYRYPKIKSRYTVAEAGNFAPFPPEAEKFVLLIDTVRLDLTAPPDWFGRSIWLGTGDNAAFSIAARHSKKAQILFVDGHVEAKTKAELITLDSAGRYPISGPFCPIFPQFVVESND